MKQIRVARTTVGDGDDDESELKCPREAVPLELVFVRGAQREAISKGKQEAKASSVCLFIKTNNYYYCEVEVYQHKYFTP